MELRSLLENQDVNTSTLKHTSDYRIRYPKPRFGFALLLARRYHRKIHRHQLSSSTEALEFFHLRGEERRLLILLILSLISHYNEKVHHCHHFCRGRRSRWIWAWSNIAGIPRESSSGEYRSKETKAYPHRRMSRNRYVCVHAHSRA